MIESGICEDDYVRQDPRPGAGINGGGGGLQVSLCARPRSSRCPRPSLLSTGRGGGLWRARHGSASCSRYPGVHVGRALRGAAGDDDPHLQTRVSDVHVTPPLFTDPAWGGEAAGRDLSEPCSLSDLFQVPDPRLQDPVVARW